MKFGEVILHLMDHIHDFVSGYNDRLQVVTTWDKSKSAPLQWKLGKNEITAYIVLYAILNSEARNLSKVFESSTTGAWTDFWKSINEEGSTIGISESHLIHTTILNQTLTKLIRFDSQFISSEPKAERWTIEKVKSFFTNLSSKKSNGNEKGKGKTDGNTNKRGPPEHSVAALAAERNKQSKTDKKTGKGSARPGKGSTH